MNMRNRIYLSTLEEDHIYHFMELSADPELVATEGWSPFQKNEKDRFLEWFHVITVPYLQDGQTEVFSIIKSDDLKAIGFTSLKGMHDESRKAELGIAIMEKDSRGKGYGTEALDLTAKRAFKELGLEMLGLTVFPANKRAVRAYEKVGFQRKELLKDSWLLPDGNRADMLLMELSSDRWFELRE